MQSLSSRAMVSTHGASYVYNYSDFRGDSKQLLAKYFDVYFYIANWGTVELMFKYPAAEIKFEEIKKYAKEYLISCEKSKNNIIVGISISTEDGFGWLEGAEWLPEFLPFYDELKKGDYRLLELAKAIDVDEGDCQSSDILKKKSAWTGAQEALLKLFDVKY